MPSNLDRIGTLLEIGDMVAVAKGSSIVIGQIVSFTAQMVNIAMLGKSGRWVRKPTFRTYPGSLVKIDQDQALVYLLSQGAECN